MYLPFLRKEIKLSSLSDCNTALRVCLGVLPEQWTCALIVSSSSKISCSLVNASLECLCTSLSIACIVAFFQVIALVDLLFLVLLFLVHLGMVFGFLVCGKVLILVRITIPINVLNEHWGSVIVRVN